MTRTLMAINTAPDSENRMHGDEARRYGFSSGLVPGSTCWPTSPTTASRVGARAGSAAAAWPDG